ncbi:TAXI family TRAP transporter solute-binding subunit [Magnetospirillum sulfuroxidans]|uniref:TAXI family TRAP transporter solute-binding subunit n=1 Tax=Magnetospirillum sulfuroxidans TaxID=611300 RepID=A0ABS5IDN0_9PROT|nr:TAXI family TRAP transporter solute-binding subunit [Magnetospirillum sulfuroxidans]MBR9972519.1 TAXI family TRAP transporter solute-binding subunit [Magnetospirillum sulfuroxidans]
MQLMRRLARAAVLAVAVGTLGQGTAGAQELRFFQLGTGPTGETRFPVGGLIANAISNPPGSRECEKGGSCGVPGLVAVAKSTNGSIANVEAIGQKRLDAALVHADIAYWAYHGTGIYKGKGAVSNLRGIAMLYPETLHLVVRKDARIASVKDLKGKRVSFGDKDSSSAIHGRLLLEAFRLNEKQIKQSFLKPGPSADALADGKLDAFLMLDAFPVPVIADLARKTEIAVVPLDGGEIEKMLQQYPFLLRSEITAGTYQGVPEAVKTLGVGVALVTGAEQDEKLIYGVTRALWHPSTQKLFTQNSPSGAQIHLDAEAIEKMGIQVHGGASAFYFDAGLVR